mmetsp:Transcript_62561/g.73159  ORF Transcript_62561/g.73159 Transcript_62561/m.73159 type:complete len:120 (-) Transcript_62561:67-426(-)
MVQRSGPQFGGRAEEVYVSVPLVGAGSDLGAEGLREEIVVVEMSVAVGEDGAGGGVDEIEIVEAFVEDYQCVGCNEGCARDGTLRVVHSIGLIFICIGVGGRAEQSSGGFIGCPDQSSI